MPKPSETSKENMLNATQVRTLLERLVEENLDVLSLEEHFQELKRQSKLPLKEIRSAYFKAEKEIKHKQQGVVLSKEQLQADNPEAELLAKNSNLFPVFQEDLRRLGYIAPDVLASTLLISHGARLLSKSTGFIVEGLSSSGKTDAVLKAAQMLPPEVVLSYTALSEQAFFYMGDIKHKYLILGEIKPLQPGQDDERQSAMRQLISENKLTKLVVEKTDGSINKSVEKVTEGPCVVIATTTRSQQHWNDEFANRLSWVSTDGSEDLTRQVMQAQAHNAQTAPSFQQDEVQKRLVKKWQAFHRTLKPMPVRIPFATYIIPSAKQVTARRLYELLLVYIKIVALLHQHSRVESNVVQLFSSVQSNDEQSKVSSAPDELSSVQCSQSEKVSNFIEAVVDDYDMAYRLIMANAPRVLELASKPALAAYEKLQKKFNNAQFTTGDAQRELEHPKETVRRWLYELTSSGLLNLEENKKSRQNVYSIGTGMGQIQDLGLVSPDELRRKLSMDGSLGEHCTVGSGIPSVLKNGVQVATEQFLNTSRLSNPLPDKDQLVPLKVEDVLETFDGRIIEGEAK